MTAPVPTVSPESIEMVRKFAAKAGAYTKQVVEQAIKLIHMGLGNPAKVDQARTAWNTTAVTAVNTGENDIRNALPELRARWSGPASTSFNGYAGNVLTASDKMSTALGGVGGALTDAFNKANETYQAVVRFIGACGENILHFLGSVTGAIQEKGAELVGKIAGAILDALAKFVHDYSEAVVSAIGIIGGYKNAANTATSAVAKLGENLVPALPASAGDADSYTPVKQGS